MWRKSKANHHLKVVLCLAIIFQMIFPGLAFAEGNNPRLIINQQGGRFTGQLFTGAEGPLYPGGPELRNVLTIQNDFGKRLELHKLGMSIQLSKSELPLSLEDNSAKDFLRNMKIKVRYRNPITNFFEGNVYEGDFGGFMEGADCSVKIGNRRTLDLIYIVRMHEDAEANISGMTADVGFWVGVKESPEDEGIIINPPVDGGENPIPPTQPPVRETPVIDVPVFIEEPVEVMPGIGGLEGLSDEVSKSSEASKTPEQRNRLKENTELLLKLGILKGYPDGSIKPEKLITRAEAAAIIGRTLQVYEENTSSLKYRDIKSIPKWAIGYVVPLTKKVVFKGTGTRFVPNRHIYREEMAAVLTRAFDLKAENIPMEFMDTKQIAKWAVDEVIAVVQTGVFVGYEDNTFRPKQAVMRGDLIDMIARLIELQQLDIKGGTL